MQKGLQLGGGRIVPWSELRIRTSRSGGPGGQHANKVETQVEVVWDLEASASFTPEEKARLRSALGHRLARRHLLRVRSRAARSQLANRRAAVERLGLLLERALLPPRSRKATRPTRSSKEARLAEKRHSARRKTERRRPELDD